MATGPFGSSIGTKTFRAVGIPVLRGSNLSADVGTRLIEEDLVFIDPKLAEGFRRSQVTKDDLVFTCWGTINQVGLIDGANRYPRYVISNKQMKVTADTAKVLPLYLYYWFSGPEAQSQILAGGIGSSVPGFNLGQLRRMRVPLPCLGTQQAITSVLGALDDKIDLNRRMNETLEAMARAIFKDWFVDFVPTRAKMERRDPYLASELWSLFPHRLDDAGNPEGWERAYLGQHVVVTKGKSYTSDELRDATTALVTLKSFERGGGYRRDGLKAFAGECKPEQIVREGDIVVAQTDVTQAAAVIGRPARVVGNSRFSRLVASLDVAIVRPQTKTCLDTEFAYGLLRTELFTEHTFAHSTGTTVLHLSKEAIPSFEFVLPARDLVKAFSTTVSPLSERLIQNCHESDTLAATRDLLLPKLMSGEIRIKEAEKEVQAVA
jgi:type I restriction enzyme, S subunit